jgi:hypothetical protein
VAKAHVGVPQKPLNALPRITTIKRSALTSSTMIAAENYQALLSDVVLLKYELLEIHRSKISLHHAKAGYNYPTIRLPHTLSKLPVSYLTVVREP